MKHLILSAIATVTPSHCCNHYAVVAINSDRASCHRYCHRSLQEFSQPDWSKSFRTIALLASRACTHNPTTHQGA